MYVKSNRSDYIDIVKGIAIFLVLWGHCLQKFSFTTSNYPLYYFDTMFQFIYSFHMPLFMLISGYLTKNLIERHEIIRFIKKRIKGLGIPMLVWGLGFAIIINIYKGTNITLGTIKGGILSLWFLWSLLVLSVFFVSVNLIKNHRLKMLSYITVLIAIIVLPQRAMTLYMLPYFLVGFLIRKYNDEVLAKINVFSMSTFVLAGGR